MNNPLTNETNLVKEKWNQLINTAVLEKRNLLVLAAVLFTSNMILTGAMVQLATRPRLVACLIEVDSIGKAVAVGQAREIQVHDEKIFRAYLLDFLEKSKSIITDTQVMRNNLSRTYNAITPETKNYLDEFYRQNNPFEAARKFSRQILAQSVIKQSDKSYLIEWKEIDRDLNNKIVRETRWKGLFTTVQKPPKTNEDLIENPFNPFGIYISNVSWSKVLTQEEQHE